ncbi:S-layer homology domain-containing protein [Paenibacillus chondroitinus]|uniref:S-layer homology domain-containing protein n=1 Tax=Paenibacillus chondroitinus TaxID=59842 RepID=A0ABU6DGJ6_9BACL|nr:MULTISPECIES: S-layer homology domain-containing protein [Paenibacillus]MCY9657299.1 S-layer homology domain-containing protein [Paenibacillus anseongense]MEB4795962.1 S-layer homology domain-containing protein [Paenibacillus chondroitinus]
MKRKIFGMYLTLMMCMLLVPISTWAADSFTYTLTISNDKPEVGKDKEINVTVTGDNLQDVYAYEVNFVYDPNQLRFKGAKSAIDGFSIPAIVKDNQIQFASTKIGNKAGESGKVPLCTLTFEPIGKGQAAVELTDVKLVTSKMVSSKQNADTQIAMDITNDNAAMFRDITGHWAKEAIERAAKLGFVNGYEDGTFRPQGLITRAEFATMLARAIHLPLNGQDQLVFADEFTIPEWAKSSIASALNAGIVSGYEDNTFRPVQMISRAEITTMIVRASGIQTAEQPISTFADKDQIPAWAYAFVAAAAEAGLVQGKGDQLFMPNDNATRAEAVTLLLSLLDYKK